jgi:hypothetical protein
VLSVDAAINAVIEGSVLQVHQNSAVMPSAAKERVVVAWLSGGVMAWLVERYRRQTFAGQHLAKAAHAKELAEKQSHLQAQQELAAAREEVPPPKKGSFAGINRIVAADY